MVSARDVCCRAITLASFAAPVSTVARSSLSRLPSRSREPSALLCPVSRGHRACRRTVAACRRTACQRVFGCEGAGQVCSSCSLFGFAPKQFGGKGPAQRAGAGDEFFRAAGPASFLSGAQRNGPQGRKLVKNSLEAFTPS